MNAYFYVVMAMSAERKRILFIVPYPRGVSPSQRFRFEQYLHLLEAEKITYDFRPFYSLKNWQVIFEKHSALIKALVVISCMAKRLLLLLSVPTYDFVFIHREASPVGPPIAEWIIAKILRKPMIYDFDDAIWMTDNENESNLLKKAKCRWKVSNICRWAWKVSCGNKYLQNYALQFNSSSFIVPTTIDLAHHTQQSKNINDNITIGWTGSHSTLKYLKLVERSLHYIQQKFPAIKIVVIADRPPDIKLKNIFFIKWNLESEIADLNKIDIGVMPLPDDEWSKGKCGFKILQYFAVSAPAVASPVGVNASIIQNGVNGFLCTTESEWNLALEKLINDSELRTAFGKRGYDLVRNHYSVDSNASAFLSLFK